MLLKRWAVPGKEAARPEKPLAAGQPCPQHYSWYKSLCFCCPEDSFIYFPLNLENRSLFFSYSIKPQVAETMWIYLYFTGKQAHKGSFTFWQRTERTDQFSSVQGFIHSSKQHRSKHLGPLHPCCKRCGMPAPLQITYLGTPGLHPESIPPPWKRQLPGQLSPDPGNSPAQSSQQLLLPPRGSPSSPPAPVKTGVQQPPPSHAHMQGSDQEHSWEAIGELWTQESIFQLFPRGRLIGWDKLITWFLVRLLMQVSLPFIHF